jgi:hypothetical protein
MRFSRFHSAGVLVSLLIAFTLGGGRTAAAE